MPKIGKAAKVTLGTYISYRANGFQNL